MSYKPPANDEVDFTVKSYDTPSNDAVDFSLEEETERDLGPFTLPSDPLGWPMGIDFPMSLSNVRTMNTGFALFIIGLLVFLGGAVTILRNYVGAVVLGLAVVALVMSGTLGIGLEYFWGLVLLTVLMLMIGAVVRVVS